MVSRLQKAAHFKNCHSLEIPSLGGVHKSVLNISVMFTHRTRLISVSQRQKSVVSRFQPAHKSIRPNSSGRTHSFFCFKKFRTHLEYSNTEWNFKYRNAFVFKSKPKARGLAVIVLIQFVGCHLLLCFIIARCWQREIFSFIFLLFSSLLKVSYVFA